MALLIVAGVALRVYFAMRVPILDNDSASLLLAAKRLTDHGMLTPISPLPTLLAAGISRLTSFPISAADGRLTQVLASIGILFLVFFLAKRIVSQAAALLAVALMAIMPLAVFYAGISKVYSLGSFFVLLALWLIFKAQEKTSLILGGLAGLALVAAFLTKTFMSFVIAPIALLALVISLNRDRDESAWRPRPLWACIVAFGVLMIPIVIWRMPQNPQSFFDLVMSVLNDYEVDWLTHYSWAAWSGRWIGLVNYQALALSMIAPGSLAGAYFAARGPTGGRALLALVVLTNMALVLINPVNHFPRTALPMAAILAIWTGAALAGTKRDGSGIIARGMPWGLLASSIAALLIFYRQRAVTEPFIVDFIGPVTVGSIVWAMVFFSLIAFAVAALMGALLRISNKWLTASVSSLALVATAAWTVPFTFDSAQRQTAEFEPKALAASLLDDPRSIGGTDLALLADDRAIGVLVDLPEDRLADLVAGNINAALEPMGLTGLILTDPLDAHDRTVFELFAEEHGFRAVDLMDHLWRNQSGIDRIYDVGSAAAYQLRGMELESRPKTVSYTHLTLPTN